MGMNLMSPKAPPPAPGFKLLAELNEYTRLPQEEREAILADYVAATEQRQVMLDVMAADKDAAAEDREGAAQALRDADQSAKKTVNAAQTKGKGIIAAANKQAESVNRKVAENVAGAAAQAETAADEAREREDAVKAREDACEEREANAFKEREDAVTLREDKVTKREREAEDMHALGVSTKEGYEALLRQINALVPSAAAAE